MITCEYFRIFVLFWLLFGDIWTYFDKICPRWVILRYFGSLLLVNLTIRIFVLFWLLFGDIWTFFDKNLSQDLLLERH